MLKIVLPIVLLLNIAACNSNNKNLAKSTSDSGFYEKDSLPDPFATKSTQNFSKVVGWENGITPKAPQGFVVSRFADNLDNPRWIYVAENGDIFIAESNTILHGIKKFGAKISRKIKTQNLGESANRITMFRDADKNGVFESRFIFAENLNQNLGMLILNGHFYVANTDGVFIHDYAVGDTKLKGTGKKIISLPAGGYNNHWTRNIIRNEEGNKIYVSVGSGSNVGENGMDNEIRRANILQFNPDGSGETIYAAGLRNPVGMDFATGTNVLWTAVNERDELGDDLVPDYITSVQPGGFYGWPYSYYGKNIDPRMKDNPRMDLVNKSIVPDVSLGSHTASLGLTFYDKETFPTRYHNGAFVGQHGSWNRSVISGYKVVFVPFANGQPSGPVEDFLTGFISDVDKSEVYGRPVCVAVLEDGSMLVTDDVSKVIWRVAASK